MDNLRQGMNSAGDAMSDAAGSMNDSISGMKDQLSSSLDDFSDENVVGASSGFLSANTVVAKFVFLILVLIVFMFIFKAGVYVASWMFLPSQNPYLVYGMIPGSNGMRIQQNPNLSDAITLQRSNNETTGAEFTYSVWLNITGGNTTSAFAHIFNKGGDGTSFFTDQTGNGIDGGVAAPGIAKVNNAPGLYLSPSSVDGSFSLRAIMNTVSPDDINIAGGINTYIDVTDIPINNKWIHVVIRLQNTILDVYVNGTISGRLVLQSVPKQNYDDVWVCKNLGFSGFLSNLRYYSTALSVFEISNIFSAGANTATSSSAASITSLMKTDYLSNGWYASKL